MGPSSEQVIETMDRRGSGLCRRRQAHLGSRIKLCEQGLQKVRGTGDCNSAASAGLTGARKVKTFTPASESLELEVGQSRCHDLCGRHHSDC
jgi:hypothetical protein